MINEKQVIDFLRTKDRDYVRDLVNSLDIESPNNDTFSLTKICPICGSSSTKKNGKDDKDQQRYYCSDCHKSFNDRTGTILHWSHLSIIQWKNFIDCEVSKLTLEDTAHFMGISITTCFYMRHKLYNAVSEIMSHQVVSENVEVDTQYLKINLKGTKPKNMPRISKKRGNTSAFRGISHHKISLICAVDSNDHMIMRVTGLGSESFEKYKANEKYFDNVDTIVSDSKASIQQLANLVKATNHKIPTSPLGKRYLTNNGESLGTINEMMSEVTCLITKTRGFSTRYLQGYLDFNLFRKQMRYQYKRKDVVDEIFKLIIQTKSFNDLCVLATPMPVSLKEAYYEYRYGIFA